MSIKSLTVSIRRKGDVKTAEAIETLDSNVLALDRRVTSLHQDSDILQALKSLSVSAGQGVVILGNSVALSDPNDFGLRFWLVTINYDTTDSDITAVEAWAEDPADDPAKKNSTDVYNTGQSNAAVAIFDPTDTSRSVRIYLVPVSPVTPYQLKTLAQFPTDSSPYIDVTLGAVSQDQQGVEWVPNVTGFTVTGPTYFYDANGLYRGKISATFTAPSDPRWGGVEIVAKKPGPRYVSLGIFAESPTGDIQVEVPPSIESWRIFARSVDRLNKPNSINESAQGEPTPYQDISIGDTSGKLDLGKALTASVGSALEVVANVLGVQTQGIDESLIKDFAVSKQKLLNAPIIDSARIENLAVTDAHIQNMAANKVLAGTLAAGVIYSAQINAIQVNAGLFDGHTLRLQQNGATARWDSELVGSQYSALTVESDTDTDLKTMIWHQGVFVNSSLGTAIIQLFNLFDLPWLNLLNTSGQARAQLYINGSDNGRLKLSGSAPGIDMGTNQVLTERKPGWSLWTGTLNRTGKPTSTATLQDVAETVGALVYDLVSHGLIGA